MASLRGEGSESGITTESVIRRLRRNTAGAAKVGERGRKRL